MMGLTQHKLNDGAGGGWCLVAGTTGHTPPPAKATSHLLRGGGDEGTTLRAAGSETSVHGRTLPGRPPQFSEERPSCNPILQVGRLWPQEVR